ncbi:pseudouridine synthase [Aquabacterium lacunae]|uniref:Pseudouridine synthase n=1 Tax=Aquabacterium lacunae TaxID=2528630 RepID=A0A4Q9H0Z3_9BURK|nr:pseudouridine synthase [Aquabacterium lacunae]TBO28732.1 pseudouridine synthase [Aquabacterium lacunae]
MTDHTLPIVWQDDDCVVLVKPAGWLVHRTGLDAGETRFVVQTLRDQLGRKVYPVHRLDKGTSGVMAMALNSEAASRMATAFEAHAVHKRYLALVRGWAPDQADVDHPLRPDDASPETPPQAAHTRFARCATLSLPLPVDRYPSTRASLVQAWPTTGRRHQIRRHLKHLAHPIIGDATHGKGALNRWWAERWGVQRLWLHASELSMPHPFTQELMVWRVDPLEASDRQRWPEVLADWSAVLKAEPWQWAEAPGHATPPGHCRVDEPGA